MLFKELVVTLEELEKISSTNAMQSKLAKLFKKCSAKQIRSVIYLVLGEIDAEVKGVETGLAGKMVMRSIALASGAKLEAVRKYYKKKGDLGLVAEHFMQGKHACTFKKYLKTRKTRLTANDVVEDLRAVAEAGGKGSQEKKVKSLAAMLQCASPKEAKYLVRITLGHLRIGVGVLTLLNALSVAFTGSKKAREQLEDAYNVSLDPGLVAETVARKGLKGIKSIKMAVGAPINMMLAQRVGLLQEITKHDGDYVAVDEKYDGERVQVHKNRQGIFLYSRRLENITKQYPDVVAAVRKGIKAKSFIIEGETVPIDKKGRILDFQRLMQRKRKHDIEKYIKDVPVTTYFFDVLYLNGKNVMHKTFKERRKLLEKIANTNSKGIALARQITAKTTDIKKIKAFFHESLKRNNEGIMVKSLGKDSFYKAGTRGWLWIKWKKDYVDKMRDTFDLAVVGAFAGRGARAGNYGALLCAAFNEKKDHFETACRLGSGFTDKDLAGLAKKLSKFKVKEKPARVESKIQADAWFKPGLVIELTGAEVTSSPVHTCAQDLVKGRGLAIRFPRMLRWREDKKPEQSTTDREIFKIYKHKKRRPAEWWGRHA